MDKADKGIHACLVVQSCLVPARRRPPFDRPGAMAAHHPFSFEFHILRLLCHGSSLIAVRDQD